MAPDLYSIIRTETCKIIRGQEDATFSLASRGGEGTSGGKTNAEEMEKGLRASLGFHPRLERWMPSRIPQVEG